LKGLDVGFAQQVTQPPVRCRVGQRSEYIMAKIHAGRFSANKTNCLSSSSLAWGSTNPGNWGAGFPWPRPYPRCN